MLNYLRKERRHRGCVSLGDSNWNAREHDGRGQEREEYPPITTTEALHQIEDFLSQIELLLLEQPMCAITQLLTARQHEIFSMRYSQGLRPSEIARALGVSPARVSQVLTEAVAKLRQAFVPLPNAQ
jgi:RNA polymerase sigma factor (sigma-70 family)